MSNGKLILILTPLLLLLVSPLSLAQHRDESQMLRKPGSLPAHARLHFKELKNSKKHLPADSIKTSAAAEAISDRAEEPADNYLQKGIRLLQDGDYTAALKSFGEASRQGNHEAQYRIGLMYRDGTGVAADDKEAAYWFRKAGSNGHAEAQYEIALCFMAGKGVLQDSRVAGEWMWRAAEQGHPMASLYVARMYRDGVGMSKDLRRAAKYMRIAADAGIEEAQKELEEINRQLPAAAPTEKSKKPTTKADSNKKLPKLPPRSDKPKRNKARR